MVIRLLSGHALIESVKDFGGYGIHICVHAWAVNLLNSDWEISMASLVLNCVGSSVPTRDVSEFWAIERRLLPHACRCLDSIYRCIDDQHPHSRNICQAIHGLGYLYHNQGKMQEAEDVHRRAL